MDVIQFNDNEFDSIFSELETLGIHFTSLAEFSNEEVLNNRFWDLWWELVTDVPGMEEKPRPENERMINLVKDYDKKGFILAIDGEKWVALSMIL